MKIYKIEQHITTLTIKITLKQLLKISQRQQSHISIQIFTHFQIVTQ